jgi:hypothetical protein
VQHAEVARDRPERERESPEHEVMGLVRQQGLHDPIGVRGVAEGVARFACEGDACEKIGRWRREAFGCEAFVLPARLATTAQLDQ